MKKNSVILTLLIFASECLFAQMAKDNHYKFLGNITTSYNWVEYCDPQECSNSYVYSDYWNQVTCENATKWGSVHKGWGTFSWDNADRTYNYCKQKGILFKFHALIWGSQHPSWIESLSVDDTKKAIIEWFDEVQNHYPDLEIIDVVNEAIYSGGNYHSPYKETKIIEALGSLAEDRAQEETGTRPSYNCNTNGYSGTNSYQWIAEAFRLARDRWPNAILIYNDYNTFQWQKTEFINLINGLKDCGAPIDAAGNQSHDLNDMSGSQFKSALEDIHNKTGLPQYITEYDICKSDDETFLTRYKEQFPIMWEADYVPGVTLWGWIYGKTWVNDGNETGASGLVRNCQKRSAFTWLEEYMKTDAAKNAKGPDMSKKGIKASMGLSSDAINEGDELTVTVTASATGSEITGVDLYAGDELIGIQNDSLQYTWTFTPNEAGVLTIKAVVHDNEGNTKEVTKSVTICAARKAYKEHKLPGTIEIEDFDEGCDGVAFHDSDEENEGGEYRNTGVDIVEGNGGYAVGYTAKGEWLEYTVTVEYEDTYAWEMLAASGSKSSAFSIWMGNENITGEVSVPQTADNDWSVYEAIKGETSIKLPTGTYQLRLAIESPYCNLDKITFKAVSDNTDVNEAISYETTDGEYDIYTLLGIYVGKASVGKDWNDLNDKLAKGTYVLKNTKTGKTNIHIIK